MTDTAPPNETLLDRMKRLARMESHAARATWDGRFYENSLRGQALDYITREGWSSNAEVSAALGQDPSDVSSALAKLHKQGLAERRGEYRAYEYRAKE